jgi:hypothetical protein
MLNALSPKRLELLRAVRESPPRSVKSLAERLGRDYKRVHEDVVGDLDGMSERVKQGTPGDEYWPFFSTCVRSLSHQNRLFGLSSRYLPAHD